MSVKQAPSLENVAFSEHLDLPRPEAESTALDLLQSGEKPLRLTVSLCPGCLEEERYREMRVPALVLEREGEVWMRKECTDHGEVEDVYWSDHEMYRDAAYFSDDGLQVEEPQVPECISCPTSCGLCPEHESHTALGNIVVTNRCDLSCNYCFFYARDGEPIYEPSLEQIREMMRNLRNQEPVGANSLQITGGEPTVRDDAVEIVEAAKEEGFDHVQFNTDGINLSKDPGLVEELKKAGVNVVYLSFDGLTPSTNPKNYYEAPDALRNLRAAGLSTVLVPTVIGGINDHELGDIVRLAADNSDVVRGVNFQPVSIVGRMPREDRLEKRVTIPDICRGLREQTGGALKPEHFYPIPVATRIADFLEELEAGERDHPVYRLSTHFTCGVGTYVFQEEDRLVPINEFLDVEGFFNLLERLTEEMEGSRFTRVRRIASLAKLLYRLRDLIDREKQPEGVDAVGAIYRALRNGDYDGLRRFHHQATFVGTMHFMDPYNYDVDRIKKCDIHYATPDGRIIPFCSFNVLPGLYRDKVQEQFATPFEEWRKETGKDLEQDRHRRNRQEERQGEAEEFYEEYRREAKRASD